MMKKTILVCSVLLLALNVTSVNAASKAKSYKNCTELRKDYKGGVAQSSSAKTKVVKPNTSLMFPKNFIMRIRNWIEIKI